MKFGGRGGGAERAPEWPYSIGEAAKLAGVTTGVLRMWEREGLIRPGRTVGGHRIFVSEDVDRLRRIAFLRRVERLNAAAIRRELGPARNEPPATPPNGDVVLGARLRALRTGRKLSLATVAERTGLSISFLSAVERGQTGISLGNLFKLADAYGTTVPGLQRGARRSHQRVVRPSERPRYEANHGRVLIEDLITETGALEAQRFEILPGGESEEAYAHPGEEFVYVLSGQLTFWLEERAMHELRAGDSLHLPSTQLHRWRNQGDVPATVLWVNVPVVDVAMIRSRGRRADRGRNGKTVADAPHGQPADVPR